MGPEVHFHLTRRWALEEGFSAPEADLIASADVSYDVRYPASASLLNITRHFSPMAWLWSERYLRQAARGRDLRLLGWALHAAQDAVAHGRLGHRHLMLRAGWGRDPDVWELAQPSVRRRIETTTRRRLRRYRRRAGQTTWVTWTSTPHDAASSLPSW